MGLPCELSLTGFNTFSDRVAVIEPGGTCGSPDAVLADLGPATPSQPAPL